MALTRKTAAKDTPEKQLQNTVSEFEAVLSGKENKDFLAYKTGPKPTPKDVFRFITEIDGKRRAGRSPVGARLTNVLQSVQRFTSVVDVIVGGSQNLTASAIWGVLTFSLKVAVGVGDYLDKLTSLLMNVGRVSPLYEDMSALFPRSRELQDSFFEYYAEIVRLCKKTILFSRKTAFGRGLLSITKPFDSEFGSSELELQKLGLIIRERVDILSKELQTKEAEENSRFRELITRFSAEERKEKKRRWKIQAKFSFLNTLSTYDHRTSWKQATKKGVSTWLFNVEKYNRWRDQTLSSALWMTGNLGSGKSVLTANVISNLMSATAPWIVAYFFCRYDEAETLKPRNIIGSLARQLLTDIEIEMDEELVAASQTQLDPDDIIGWLLKILPQKSGEFFIVIDGVDECEEEDIKCVLECLAMLLKSQHTFKVYYASRPELRWASTLFGVHEKISMSEAPSGASNEISLYIRSELERRLELGSLCIGDPAIILDIEDALLQGAQGMFLWVAFQFESICAEETDDGILRALEKLPKSLPETFDRILGKLNQGKESDPKTCQKLFELVAGAQRPLTVEELREAYSVDTGYTSWDPKKIVNDIVRLLDRCKSLLVIDEEQLTVHFTHHSVLKYLIYTYTPGDMASPLDDFKFEMPTADHRLGQICVTYLSYDVFDKSVVRVAPGREAVRIDPSAIVARVDGNLPSTIASKLALKLLRHRTIEGTDIRRVLEKIVQEQPDTRDVYQYHFHAYAQEFWLVHTKIMDQRQRDLTHSLFGGLLNSSARSVKWPWGSGEEFRITDIAAQPMSHLQAIRWIVQNDHVTLLKRILTHAGDNKQLAEVVFDLLKGLPNGLESHWELYSALMEWAISRNAYSPPTYLRGLLMKGAPVYGTLASGRTLIQEAVSRGSLDHVRLLLEHGADVNAEGGALDEAFHQGFGEDKIRILLESGAHVNARRGREPPLMEAVTYASAEAIDMLLDAGADLHAQSDLGNALQAASAQGRDDFVRLLLDRGADMNASSKIYDSALAAAAQSGHSHVVLLLLGRGAGKLSAKVSTAIEAARKVLLSERLNFLEEPQWERVIQILESSLAGKQFGPDDWKDDEKASERNIGPTESVPQKAVYEGWPSHLKR